jgi:hypothetical protein
LILQLHQPYAETRKQAAGETELNLGTLPKECAWEIDDLLRDD